MKKRPIPRTIAGAILAGGNASRMGGVAKGMIKIDRDISIAEHLIAQLRCAGISEIVIVANDPSPYLKCGVEIISDMRTGIGPLAGIESALSHFAGRCDAVLFVPCDVPNITAKEIQALTESFVGSNASVVFAQTGGSFCHPLCAVVHNETLAEISAAIDRGERKIQNVWARMNNAGVLFDDENVFVNINSPADMETWRKAKK